MAQSGGIGRCSCSRSIADKKPALRMGFSTRALEVMGAQSFRYFFESSSALGFGLAFPRENESLAADAAMQIWGKGGAFAQDLHVLAFRSCRSVSIYSGNAVRVQ